MPVPRTQQPPAGALAIAPSDREPDVPTTTATITTPAETLVTFMHNSVGCEACRLLAKAGLKGRGERLHVLTTSDYLVVTDVDDIHSPGASVSGQRIADVASGSVYRLLPTPAPFVDPRRHVGASGIALLTVGRGGRHLVAVGSVDGGPCDHDRVFDAIEER